MIIRSDSRGPGSCRWLKIDETEQDNEQTVANRARDPRESPSESVRSAKKLNTENIRFSPPRHWPMRARRRIEPCPANVLYHRGFPPGRSTLWAHAAPCERRPDSFVGTKLVVPELPRAAIGPRQQLVHLPPHHVFEEEDEIRAASRSILRSPRLAVRSIRSSFEAVPTCKIVSPRFPPGRRSSASQLGRTSSTTANGLVR